MDLEKIKTSLEKEKEGNAENEIESTIKSLPLQFLELFILHGIKCELVEHGRVLCSLIVPPRLVDGSGNSMHGGAIATLVDWVGGSVVYTVGAEASGVSVDINVSYLDTAYLGEEIEIEAKALLVGRVIAVVTVELRKKNTGKLIAHGRHSMYMAVQSRM